MPVSSSGEIFNLKCRPVRQGIHFQIAPDVLDRVEFRRVGRQEEGMQLIGTFEKAPRTFGAVGVEAIPEQHARALQFLVQMPEEAHHLPGADLGVGMETKIEPHVITAGRHTERRQGGYLPEVTTPLKQHRSLAPRLPAATHQRFHQQAAFVEENQPGVQPVRFFLSAGQVCLIHCRIPSSSRSTARRAGFCGLQPSEWSKRPIWST